LVRVTFLIFQPDKIGPHIKKVEKLKFIKPTFLIFQPDKIGPHIKIKVENLKIGQGNKS
jgi:hypothetical protein